MGKCIQGNTKPGKRLFAALVIVLMTIILIGIWGLTYAHADDGAGGDDSPPAASATDTDSGGGSGTDNSGGSGGSNDSGGSSVSAPAPASAPAAAPASGGGSGGSGESAEPSRGGGNDDGDTSGGDGSGEDGSGSDSDTADTPAAEENVEEDVNAPDPGQATVISNISVTSEEGGQITGTKENVKSYSAKTYTNPRKDETAGINGKATPDNALAKAVKNALSNVDSSTVSVTVELDEGTYAGDLNISDKLLGDGVDLRDDFVLNIVSKSTSRSTNNGKVSALPDGTAAVSIAGNIIISKINVMLAGLTLGEGNTITVSGADLWYVGAAGDDNVAILLKDGARTDVVTGDGNDVVAIAAEISTANDDTPARPIDGTYAVKVSTGAGDDSVSLTQDSVGVGGFTATNGSTVQANLVSGGNYTESGSWSYYSMVLEESCTMAKPYKTDTFPLAAKGDS